VKAIKIVAKLIAAIVVIIVLILAGFRGAAAFRETQTVESLAPANGKFVETSYGKIHVSIWGDEANPPVLFTHGMAAWGQLWTEVAKDISSKGFRVITIDQAPFGLSDSDNRDFTRSAQADRLMQTLKGLGISQAILVGHSYGGGVALEAALRYPELFSGMVLVCPVTGLMAERTTAEKQSKPFLLQYPFIVETGIAATATNPLITRQLLARFMYRKDMVTDEQVAILQRPLARKNMTSAMASWFVQFMSPDARALSEDRNLTAANQVAVELIWGEKDNVTPIAQGVDLAQLLKVSHFKRMPEVGHMPQLEEPKLFSEALLQSLQRIQSMPFTASLRGPKD
jgi:pimeloyl-ACP methyl ester carboxylesterase